MFPTHYKEWQNSRLNGIKKYIGVDFFKNIEVLDLGTGNGFFSQWCNSVGSKVTSVDIREEYINILKKSNPMIKTMLIDCNGPVVINQFDLIIHFSLLQHISKIDQHLISLKNKCKYMLLECEVLNTNQKMTKNVIEKGNDLSFHGMSTRCSAPYIETLLNQIGFKYRRLDDSIFNSNGHCYDWVVNNTDGLLKRGYSRFWICWTGSCPIKTPSGPIYNYVDKDFLDILKYPNGSKWKYNQFNNNIDYYFGSYRSDLQLVKPNGIVIIDRANQANKYIKTLNLYKLETIYCAKNRYKYLFFRKKGIQPKYNNVTIVIQGNDNQNTITSMCLAFINAHIVISTWSQYDFHKIEHIVKTAKYHNKSNIYYQIYTTYNGLIKVKSTPYTIKIRSDEIYSNFDHLVKLMIKHPDKLITGNQFIRSNKTYPYHISDHMIGGKTENLLVMFNTAKNLIESGKVHIPFFDKYKKVPEQILTIGYILGKNPVKKLSSNIAIYDMKNNFISISYNKLGSYLLSAHGKIYKYPNGGRLVDLPSYDCLK